MKDKNEKKKNYKLIVLYMCLIFEK